MKLKKTLQNGYLGGTGMRHKFRDFSLSWETP